MLEGIYEDEFTARELVETFLFLKSLTKILYGMSVDVFEEIDISLLIPEMLDISAVGVYPDCGALWRSVFENMVNFYVS